MRRFKLAERHREILGRYGLSDAPADKCIGAHYEQNETITQEGNRIDFLVFVIRGIAKAYLSAPDGKSLILCYYVSDGVIGEVELLKKRTEAIATVRTISDFDGILVDYAYCADELDHNMQFLQQIDTTLADKVMAIDDSYVRNALCTAEERLCVYILRNSPYGVFHDVLSDVACSIGTSYRHVFRLLANFCREGILQKDETGFRVLDPDRLAAKAKPVLQ